MRIFPEKNHLLGWLTLLLLTGFIGTSIASYLVSRHAIRHEIVTSALPLTGDTIYSEIQKDILRPVFISSLMAHDTFVRDWLLDGERDQRSIVRYLNEVKEKYGTITSFLISEPTHRYYYAKGVLKTVSEKEPRDVWYFRVRQQETPYETNVDIDMANHDAMTIFINYRVMDYNNNFIGVTGVGLTMDTMSRRLDSYEKRFRRIIYFTDANGKIMLSGQSLRERRGNIRSMPGLSDIAGGILNRSVTPTALNYESAAGTILVNSRFIPELGWYLVVEQNESEDLAPVQHVFMVNLAASFAITIVVLVLSWITIRYYQRRLERLASHDALTGILNRQAFEIIFKAFVSDAVRHRRPLSAILFDIDHFKQINDTHGHLAGDEILKEVTRVAGGLLRDSDVVARWGGEEFMVLLNNCALPQAVSIAEKLRLQISTHAFNPAPGSLWESPVTISLGVAEYHRDEDETTFFKRVDDALYQAKSSGRNRLWQS